MSHSCPFYPSPPITSFAGLFLGTERDAHVQCCNLLCVQCLSMAGIKTTKQAVGESDELFLRSCGNVYLVTLKAPTSQPASHHAKHKHYYPMRLSTARASLKGVFMLQRKQGRGLRVAGEGARVVADIVCSYRTVDGEEREVYRREEVGMKLGIYNPAPVIM